MNKQKIQAILEKLPIKGEAEHSDFVLALGDIHGQIAKALQVAPYQPGMLAEEARHEEGGYGEDPYAPVADDDWSGPTSFETTQLDDGDDDGDSGSFYDELSPYDESSAFIDTSDEGEAFKKKILTNFNSRFNEGGVLYAAEYLMIALEPSGVNIEINDESEQTLENINFFIREYGINDFFEDEFEAALYYIGEDDSVAPPTPSEGDGRIRQPETEEESLHEAHSSDAISIEIFEATTGKFASRQDNWPTTPDRVNLGKGNLSPTEAAYTSVDTTHKFFEAENSGTNYAQRIRAAREEDAYITPLNFHPIFKKLGSKATGLIVDETVSPPTVSVSLDSMTRLRQAVGLELHLIADQASKAQAELEGAVKKEEGRDVVAALTFYNEERRRLANKTDDLLSAIKSREEYITTLLNKEYRSKGFAVHKALRHREYELSSDFKNSENKMATDLLLICKQLVFIDIQKEVFHLGEGEGSSIPSKFRDNYEQLSQTFLDVFMRQLHNKIKDFFDKSSGGAWALSSFCSWVARGLQRAILCQIAYKTVFQIKTKHWNYSSCSVCGKNIYTRTAVENPKGSGRRGKTVAKTDYSEYDIPSYSLFTERGDLITEDVLNQKVGGFMPPESHPEYGGARTWEEISALVNSGSKADHIEGAIRRAEALRQLGARKTSGGNKPVSSRKYKCPYSEEGDRPPELLRSIEDAKRSGTKSNPKITDFECGLYLDPRPIIESGGKVSPESLQTIRSPATGSSYKTFEAKLDAAVTSGELSVADKDRFMLELEKRSGGGWKFSNKFFNCPTKIDILPEMSPEDRANPGKVNAAIKKEGYLSKYSYLASPISGPISAESTVYDDAGQIDAEKSRVYPPVGEDGQPANLVDGTLTYLVCGAKTSLSSFLRDGPGSLKALVKSLMADIALYTEEKGSSQAKETLNALIETLIDLGVDVGDILPLLKDSRESSLDIDLPPAIESIAHDIESEMNKAAPDAQAILKNYGRLNKISELLSIAMASPANLTDSVTMGESEKFNLIGDIKLVCSHGHTFSLRDSVYFARTHTGVNFRNRSRFQYDRNSIIASGVLSTEGRENFENTFRNLKDKNNRAFVSAAKASRLIGTDSERSYLYDEWRREMDRADSSLRVSSKKLRKTMFLGPDGEYYGFYAAPRDFIWGSEEGNKFSSARERETPDGATRTYLESTEAFTGMGAKDSDGKLTSHDAEGSAAYDKWVEQTGGSDLQGANAERLAERGIEGMSEATAVVGKLLRSFLLSMQGWLKLATTLEIHGSTSGKPDAISLEDESEGSFSLIVKDRSKGAIEAIIRQVEQEMEDELSKEAEALLEQSYSYLADVYISQFQDVDRRMLFHAPEVVREYLAVGIVKSILRFVPSAYAGLEPDELQSVINIFRRDLTKNGAVNYTALYEKRGPSGPSAGYLIDEIIRSLEPPTLSKKDRDGILLDPLATEESSRKEEWYERGNIGKMGVTDSIAQMKGKAYMGRTMEGASALYIADVVSNVYNLYMINLESP